MSDSMLITEEHIQQLIKGCQNSSTQNREVTKKLVRAANSLPAFSDIPALFDQLTIEQQ